MSETMYDRARVLYENGMPLPALELLAFQLSDDPHDARSLELKGIVLHSLGKFERACNAIEAAGVIRPLSPSAQLALADCYLAMERLALARAIYRRLASEDGVAFESLSALAKGLSEVEDYELALDVCQRAAAHRPDCHHAQYGVAYYMSKSGHPPELIYPVIAAAIELAPSVFHYRVAAVTVLSRMNEPDRAYLAVADATAGELGSVTCRCCLERLRCLYEAADDQQRSRLCGRLLASARRECSGE